MVEFSEVGFALLLTVIAGLSTGIGSAIAYFIKKPKLSYLAFAMGLSAGVMLYVSFVELLAGAMESEALGNEGWAVMAFFMGIGFIAVIDMLVPEADNPHEFIGLFKAAGTSEASDGGEKSECTAAGKSTPNEESEKEDNNAAGARAAAGESGSDEAGTENTSDSGQNSTDGGTFTPPADPVLMRAGMFTALAIAIHNLPEGLATFGTALVDVKLGIFIAFAISIHNIPEGISVSMPIYYATGDRRKAFKYSFLSGVSEPVGAVIGFLLLMPFLTDGVLDSLLAFVGGIMVYVSLDELLPMAHRYGHNHLVIMGVVSGMFMMAVSLLML